MRIGVVLLVLFAFVLFALLGAANATWTSRTAEVVVGLKAAALAHPDSVFAPRMLDDLPAPVARYLRAVLRDGTRIAWRAEIHHSGTIRADTTRRAFSPFRSVSHFDARPPGFVWDARVQMLPGIDVFVRDVLARGEGSLLARVVGIVPVADAHGDTAITSAALQRWLAETAWIPTALLPGQAVTWTAIDDSTARATVTEGGVTASLDFHFLPDGLVYYVDTDARYRSVGARTVPTPWRGEWYDWQWIEDVRIPTTGVASWELPAGWFPYWRGTVVGAIYED